MLSSQVTIRKRVLLVDGYIKEHEKLLQLSNIIPTSIYSIIFEYQLLVETWNKELSDSSATISDDRSIIHIPSTTAHSSVYSINPTYRYIFGDHTVKW